MGSGFVQVLLIGAVAAGPAACVLDGEVRRTYDDGTLASVAHYEEGVAVGTWLSYFRGGELSAERHFVDGKEHGTWRYFHTDGSLEQEGSFEHGVKVGIWRHWYRDGELWWEEEYAGGEVVRRAFFEPATVPRPRGHSEFELSGLTLRVDVPNLSTHADWVEQAGEAPLVVDLQRTMPGATVEVVESELSGLQLTVWFERALSVPSDGPDLDLREWRHHESNHVSLTPGEDGRYHLPTADEIPWLPAPTYGEQELRRAVLLYGGEGWVDQLETNKAWRDPRDGARWILSRVVLWVRGTSPEREYVEHLLVLVMPSGC